MNPSADTKRPAAQDRSALDPSALDEVTVGRAFARASAAFFVDADITQRLNLIRHLLQSTRLAVLVTGEAGIGKTASLEQLQRTADPRWWLCRVSGIASADPDKLLADLARCCDLPPDCGRLALRQLLTEHADVLTRNTRLPVIAVDDAQGLTVQALAELAALRSADDGWHLLLYTEPGGGERLKQAGFGSADRLHVLEWPRLSETQTGAYILHRLAAAGWNGPQPLSAEQLHKLHRDSRGLPGVIDRLAPELLTSKRSPTAAKPRPVAKSKRVPLRKILRATTLLVLIAAAAAVLTQQDRINALFQQQTPPAPTPIALPDRQPAPPAAAKQPDTAETAPNASLTAPEFEPRASVAEEPETFADTARAPSPAPPDRTATAASEPSPAPSPAPDAVAEPERPSAVAAAERPSAPLSTPATSSKPATAGPPAAAQTQTPAQKPAPAPEEAPQSEALAPPSPSDREPEAASSAAQAPADASAEADAATESAPPATPESTPGQQWALSRPPSHYTLQLLGSRALKPLHELIERYGLRTNTAWYKIQYQGADWYVLVHGDFADRGAASKAVAALPAGLRRAGPWPRPFTAVQEEVRRGHK